MFEDQSSNIFEERAEYLSWDELREWSIFTSKDNRNIKALKSPASKILVGPRGSGKSTLLRTAFFQMLEENVAYPVYINYSKSLALEPIFHKRANALMIFRQWLLCKVIYEAYSTASIKKIVDKRSNEDYKLAKSYISKCESGGLGESDIPSYSLMDVSEMLSSLSLLAGNERIVLLLDDAAHAFSVEQQREFFEVIRQLRSRSISYKAAVYPGITSYSENFHIDHEAGKLTAWYSPDESGYIENMRKVLLRRLPIDAYEKLMEKPEVIDFLGLCSFGMPRGFLNMVYRLIGEDRDGFTVHLKRTEVDKSVADHAGTVRAIFSSLSSKLPRYKNFVEFGSEFEIGVVGAVRDFNKNKSLSRKSVIIAIPEPIDPAVEKVLAMLEYAGMVRTHGTVSRGIKGKFRRYIIHYAIVVSENALSLGKSNSIDSTNQALLNRNAHAFTRAKIETIMGGNYMGRLSLNMSPCPSCGDRRINEEQKFCMSCGGELPRVSVYEELLKTSISMLPLPERKIKDILQQTNIRTVQDVLLDSGGGKLRTIKHVGKVWASRIATVADEFVSV